MAARVTAAAVCLVDVRVDHYDCGGPAATRGKSEGAGRGVWEEEGGVDAIAGKRRVGGVQGLGVCWL